jgi:putative (di)nucleoside polyphosphate hydrolase
MLFNEAGEVWMGRRVPKWDEGRLTSPWQCPQGGIDPGEDPETAAHRELLEEIGCNNAETLAQSREWHTYDLPYEALGVALSGKYRGQKQKWFAMHFLGDESDIKLIPPPPHKQEFDAWRWVPMDEVPQLVVPFKRDVYAAVLDEFRPVIARKLGAASPAANAP